LIVKSNSLRATKSIAVYPLGLLIVTLLARNDQGGRWRRPTFSSGRNER